MTKKKAASRKFEGHFFHFTLGMYYFEFCRLNEGAFVLGCYKQLSNTRATTVVKLSLRRIRLVRELCVVTVVRVRMNNVAASM